MFWTRPMAELQSHTNMMCGGSRGLSHLASEVSARSNGCSSCGEFSAPPVLLSCENRQSVAEISAELERERQKNAELMERIILLEAEIHEREGASVLVSQQEHVLYEHPGVRRKIFYPNRKNPILCPVQILEEEKAMRPSDPSCPSCLFLCIKYGGRTRNLPQNEIDQDAKGEELFRPHSILSDTASPSSVPLSCKSASGAQKSQGKKQMTLVKNQNPQRSAAATPPSNSGSHNQFGLMGYTSIHTQVMSALHSMQYHTLPTASQISKTSPIPLPSPNNTSHVGPVPPPYPMFPPYPMSTFMPLSYWHNTNAYTPCPYPSSYGYRPLLPVTYTPHQSHPYSSQPSCYPILPKAADNMKEDVVEPDSDSDSSSSGTAQVQQAPFTSHI